MAVEATRSILPCSVVHPDTNSCLAQNARATSATFRKTFLLYFYLTFVSFVVFRLQKLARRVFSLYEGLFPVPGGAANTTGLKVVSLQMD
ncbi:hypothetical protein C1H46_018134 [Malus baccata]|uniref:Uncharacterized protein n=1 Tax=Malus baccata TaxID=106549 RepID=A0A540MBV6_MALBA|nr:hypothetical protein C1H46_018134 [Malus baccata]